MKATHTKNFAELSALFEGKEAIYIEKGAIKVRVSDIRLRPGFSIAASVEEIRTPGLGVGYFRRRRERPPLKWTIGGGYQTAYTAETWVAGYGGWSLHFATPIVEGVTALAATFPADADATEGYRAVMWLVQQLDAGRSPSKNVFSEVAEPGTGFFHKTDGAAVTVRSQSEWVTCPYCDMTFKLTDPRRWDGKRHTTCGQRIVLET